jgi:hypothetical protein
MTTQNNKCDYCSSTGILSAKLIKNEDLSNQKIEVRLCGNHVSEKLAEKNMVEMKKSGIPLEISVVDTKALKKSSQEELN